MDDIKIANQLENIMSIDRTQIQKMISISHIDTLPKSTCFIHEGEIPRSFAFVLKGLFRYYYIDAKGNAYTKGFFPENSVISAYSALIQKRESYFTIEALEDSEILVVDYHAWKHLSANDLDWHKYLLKLLEKGFCIKEAREREFLLFDAEARYKSFLQQFPGLDKRVKQHIIASYLGITPVALSRVRKKMGNR
jgi:CRP-like cAMP-binding protein